MTIVDLIVIAVVLSAVAHGVRVGASVQVASFAGFWGGLALGAVLAPVFSRLVTGTAAHIVVGLVTVFGAASLLSAAGRTIALRVLHRVPGRHVFQIDAGLGAAVGGIVMLIAAWLVASMLSNVPLPTLTSALQRSAILRAMDRIMPPAPQVFSRIQRIIDPAGFPNVFAQFEPPAASPLPVPSSPAVAAAAARAGRSTVKIVGTACGEILEGSGFVVSRGTVVTNAHVVAGESGQAVMDASGTHRAYAVSFDPKLDIAVLHAPGVTAPSIPMSGGVVGRGTPVAFAGYPGGGSLETGGAVVLREESAVGRDIYGSGLTARDIYELQANVQPGNSGGPVVSTADIVIGVVFAKSARTPGIGYALTSPPVEAEVRSAGSSAVSTGPCTAG